MNKIIIMIVIVAVLAVGAAFMLGRSSAPGDDQNGAEIVPVVTPTPAPSETGTQTPPPASGGGTQTPPPATQTGGQPKYDPNAPAVSIKQPAQSATLSGPTVIIADVTDKTSITKVEFYVGGKLISADVYTPYEASFNTLESVNGGTTVMVRAYNALGKVTEKTVSVTIANPPSFKSFNATPAFLTEGQETKLSWEVSRATSCTASNGWSGAKNAAGLLQLTVYQTTEFTLACSGVGGSESRSVTVTVTPIAPLISITAPNSGSIARGILTVTANASDNTGIAKVEFYIGTILMGTDTSAPYSASYDTSNMSDLKYNVKVRAYDLGGNTTEATIAVTTSNQ